VSEPIPPIEPPVGPKRKPNLRDRLLALLPWRRVSPPEIQSLFTCSHRYADGTSAWSACWWNGSYWVARCAICKLVAYCR
jgi:hypothetical protein